MTHRPDITERPHASGDALPGGTGATLKAGSSPAATRTEAGGTAAVGGGAVPFGPLTDLEDSMRWTILTAACICGNEDVAFGEQCEACGRRRRGHNRTREVRRG